MESSPVITVECEQIVESWDRRVTAYDVWIHFGAMGRLEQQSGFRTTDKHHLLEPGHYYLNIYFEEETDVICRVCREGSEAGTLFHPCKCRGSVKWVHEKCVLAWVQQSRSLKCELCHGEFTFLKVYERDAPTEPAASSLVQQYLVQYGIGTREVVCGVIWFLILPFVLNITTERLLAAWDGQTTILQVVWNSINGPYALLGGMFTGAVRLASVVAIFLSLTAWLVWCKDNEHAFADLQQAQLFYSNTLHLCLLHHREGDVPFSPHAGSPLLAKILGILQRIENAWPQQTATPVRRSTLSAPNTYAPKVGAQEFSSILQTLQRRQTSRYSYRSTSWSGEFFGFRSHLYCIFFVLFSIFSLVVLVFLPVTFGRWTLWIVGADANLSRVLHVGVLVFLFASRFFFYAVGEAQYYIRHEWLIARLPQFTIARMLYWVATLQVFEFHACSFSKILLAFYLQLVGVPYACGGLLLGLMHPFFNNGDYDSKDDSLFAVLSFAYNPGSWLLRGVFWLTGFLYITSLTYTVATLQISLRNSIFRFFPDRDGVNWDTMQTVVRAPVLPRLMNGLWAFMIFALSILLLVRVPLKICRLILMPYFPVSFFPWHATVHYVIGLSVLWVHLLIIQRLVVGFAYVVKLLWSPLFHEIGGALSLHHFLFGTHFNPDASVSEYLVQDPIPSRHRSGHQHSEPTASEQTAEFQQRQRDIAEAAGKGVDFRWTSQVGVGKRIIFYPPWFELRLAVLVILVWAVVVSIEVSLLCAARIIMVFVSSVLSDLFLGARLLHSQLPSSSFVTASTADGIRYALFFHVVSAFLAIAVWSGNRLAEFVEAAETADFDRWVAGLGMTRGQTAPAATTPTTPEPEPAWSAAAWQACTSCGTFALKWTLLASFGLFTPFLMGVALELAASVPFRLTFGIMDTTQCPYFSLLETWVVGVICFKIWVRFTTMFPSLFRSPWHTYWAICMDAWSGSLWTIIPQYILLPIVRNLLLFLCLPLLAVKVLLSSTSCSPAFCNAVYLWSSPFVALVVACIMLTQAAFRWWKSRRAIWCQQAHDRQYLLAIRLQNAPEEG